MTASCWPPRAVYLVKETGWEVIAATDVLELHERFGQKSEEAGESKGQEADDE